MARLTALLALCLLTLPGGAQALDTTAFAEKVKPSIVQLEILGPSGKVLGTGTGFFISEDGLIVTNEHVIDDAFEVRAKLPDGSTRAILGHLARNPERDVALLKAEGGGYTPLPLGVDVKVQQGMKVVTVGNPLGLTFSVSEGLVAAVRPDGLPEEYQHLAATQGAIIQITAYSAMGASGSPILSEDGKVIAVLFAGLGMGGNLAFCVPVDVVAKMKADLAPGAAPKPFREFPMKGLLISGIFFGSIALLWAWSKREEWRAAALRRRALEKQAAAIVRQFRD
jgi:S1-C subfamily serine protease